jgi:hypothetical protein
MFSGAMSWEVAGCTALASRSCHVAEDACFRDTTFLHLLVTREVNRKEPQTLIIFPSNGNLTSEGINRNQKT